MMHKHTLNILVNNSPGVMSHVSGLFTRRAYNIDSIAVGVTENPEISSMTIVIKGNDTVLEQVKNQLLKLHHVLKVTDLHHVDSISRELVLLLLEAKDNTRQEIITICEVFKAKVVDMNQSSLMIEYSGDSRQINAMIQMFRKFKIIDMSRTGLIALPCQSNE